METLKEKPNKNELDTNPQSLVEFEVQPMVEARSPQEIAELLSRVDSGEIPGFLIKSEGEFNGTAPDQQVAEILSDDRGQDYEVASQIPFYSESELNSGDVAFHADSMPSDDKPTAYHVHATTEGKARIYLASPGPELAGSDINERHDESINSQFEEGQANPDYVSPHLFTAEVSDGDVIVFPISGPHPAWHKVESLSHPRISMVSVVRLKDVPEIYSPADDEGD